METTVPAVTLNSKEQLIEIKLPDGESKFYYKRYFELNGVIMYEDDMCFFLRMLGFITTPLSGLALAFKVASTIEQLTEDELNNALGQYSAHSEEDKQLFMEHLDYLDPVVVNLQPN